MNGLNLSHNKTEEKKKGRECSFSLKYSREEGKCDLYQLKGEEKAALFEKKEKEARNKKTRHGRGSSSKKNANQKEGGTPRLVEALLD